ncbi:SOS-response transcriptional repressor [Actinobacillus equuli]|nr:SOS-response transcriptional repressor [Actinobacillus equuli]
MASIRPLTRELSYQPIPMYRDMNSERSIKLDLNSLCIKRPTETFLYRLKILT